MKDILDGPEPYNTMGWKVQFRTVIVNDGPVAIRKLKSKSTLNKELLGKPHKPKDKTMWMKTEDGERIVNMNEQSTVYTYKRTDDKTNQERWHVGLSAGFSTNTLKTFKYKEDAEKYLDELMVKLNDED